jgi:hypothetical protein
MAIPKRTLILFIILVLLSIVAIIVLVRNPYPVVEVVAMAPAIG